MTGDRPREESEPFPVAVWWLALLLGVLVVGAVIWGLPNEEDDLTARAEAALEAAGIGAPATVTFEGRDARLTGTVPDPGAAEDLVYNLRGVRVLDTDLTPAPPPTTTPPTTTTMPPTTTTTAPPPPPTTTTTSSPTTTTTSTTVPPPPELPDVRVLFDDNSSELGDEARATLDGAAEVLMANPSLDVVVEGHTDSRNTEVYNQGLSERRAAAVVAYLVERGVDRSQLTHFGCGEAFPIGDNATPEGQAENRRAELVAPDERKDC